MQRIWHSHDLAPHRVRQFKLSNDPKFADKVRDVVGLYVDPPAHAVVLSMDEKSQIQDVAWQLCSLGRSDCLLYGQAAGSSRLQP